MPVTVMCGHGERAMTGASILQGVYARGLQGNAASTYALQRGAAARQMHSEALIIRRSLGDLRAIAATLNGLASVAVSAGDYPAALQSWEEVRKLRPMDQLPYQRLAGLYLSRGTKDPQKAFECLVRLHDVSLKDNRFAKRIALKVIHPSYARHKEWLQLFIDEAKLSANLIHGNVVQIFQLGEIEGDYFNVVGLPVAALLRLAGDGCRYLGGLLIDLYDVINGNKAKSG